MLLLEECPAEPCRPTPGSSQSLTCVVSVQVPSVRWEDRKGRGEDLCV